MIATCEREGGKGVKESEREELRGREEGERVANQLAEYSLENNAESVDSK